MNPHPVITAAQSRIRYAQMLVATLVISAFIPLTAASPSLATTVPGPESSMSDQGTAGDPASVEGEPGSATTDPVTVTPEPEPAATEPAPTNTDPAHATQAPVELPSAAPAPATQSPAPNVTEPGSSVSEAPAQTPEPAAITAAPLPALANLGNYEQEPNDSIGAANVIPFGTPISGTSFKDPSSYEVSDDDFFAVDLPSTGKLTLDFKFPENLGGNYGYEVEVYDSNGVQFQHFQVDPTEGSGALLASQGIFMPKGRTYIKVYGQAYSEIWGLTYTLTVNHSAGNAETEFNGDPESANPIRLGTTYSGSTLFTAYYDWEDSDLFAVDLPSAGKVAIDLKFPAKLGVGDAYEVAVYDAYGTELYYFDVPASASSGVWLKSQAMYLPKGKIYVEVYGDDTLPTWGKTYWSGP